MIRKNSRTGFFEVLFNLDEHSVLANSQVLFKTNFFFKNVKVGLH